MNVLHLNQSDIGGGAAIAAYRLHQGLLAKGVESRLLVGAKKTSSDRVAVVPRQLKIEAQLSRLNRIPSLNYLNVISSFNLPQHPFFQEADVLNLHNLHTGYFNYLAIPKLAAAKPTVWTLHDLWAFTGHCSHPYDCDRWKIGCGKCPYPDTYPAIQRDNTSIEWRLKRWASHQSPLAIVTPSHWLMQRAQQSLLGDLPIHRIPHGIDVEIYAPLETEQCRFVLGIPKGKKVLMFAAENLSDPYKGINLLLQSLAKLPASLKAELFLLILGNGGEAIAKAADIENLHLGYTSSDRVKCIAYSAADLFLIPTQADVFSLVALEAMACGTPSVSFAVGGVGDLIRPSVTGYLAQPGDTTDFSRGILQLWEDDTLRDRLSQNCRAIAVSEYSLELQAKRYIQLYQQLLSS
ncbi:glycosyltransferase family 4 protein [Oscillatoria sp. FACHB-1406]|uniref:glycosyltransferase family 4 protein n=1 Tax=Oscillatoria sp. FACHB-1406 TaxID=2692846 RepID=UPI00168546C6|nr:glycosyltransferase family 4 protein [Oscillatoria sp. FACHB-1406]MBD2579003.1 glycosyltransferase family 4 protein [Oscillatoria sp. FACHB-1406]